MWQESTINNHKKACVLLDKIKDAAFEFIKNNPNTTEYEVQQYIHKEFKKLGLQISKKHPDMIVAFNESSAIPHYYPLKENSKKLEKDSLILIDLWARLKQKDSPFSDITWIGYYGDNIPEEIIKVWNIIKTARDSCIDFISSELNKGRFPTGKEIDDTASNIIISAGYKENILHRTGHSIGFRSPHGKELGLSQKNNHPIVKNLAYTIEPGIYLKDKFGIRSEIDFYINDNNEVIITTPVQEEIIHLIPEK